MTTYTAAIGTASNVVFGDHCDVQVAENDITYHLGPNDEEVPEHTMSDRLVLDAIDTDIRTDDEDKLSKVGDAADEILAKHGWSRVEGWAIADNALYAQVERI
jgi:hypothetical protein